MLTAAVHAVVLASGLASGLAPVLAPVLAPGMLPSVPPEFTRSASGQATDGQRVSHASAPRRQVFAIVPDRTTGRDWGLRYLREAVSDFNRELPDAVFCVGDLVQGYARDHAVVRKQRDDFLGIVGRLRMPFYPTAGNHDQVSGKRDGADRSFADEYRALFGPMYYAVEAELASFVILNTEDGPPGSNDGRVEPGISDAQVAWLDRTLAELAARGKPILILFHRPLWDHKPTKWDERVHPLLVQHGVDYVIAGHYHALQTLPPRDGIPHILLGTCGGAIDQHPLAGQLQHLSFVTVDEKGSIELYHQIAGCTLPVDWVTKADQDLAYRLKTSKDAVSIRGAIEEPLLKATSGSVEVVVRNPLDRLVRFEFGSSAAPAPWFVTDVEDGQPIERVWTSRTPIDIHNPATTDLSARAVLSFEPESVEVEAGAQATVRVTARAPAAIAPVAPPPFDIVATYRDSKDRAVPMRLRQRLPLQRSIEPAKRLEEAAGYRISVWNWSEFDTPEPDAVARFVQGSGDSLLRIAIEVPDSVLSADAKPMTGKAGLEDPLGDAVRLVLGEGPQAREFSVTFREADLAPVVRSLSPDRNRLEPSTELLATLVKSPETERGWTLNLEVTDKALPPSARPPAGAGIAGLPINLGVADNDETYHTQWRWLAPKATPARIAGTAAGG